MFYPHIDYCCEIWGNTYSTNIQCLYLLQKRVVRNVTHSEYLASTNELFIKLNILKLKDIVKYKSYLFAFKAFNSKLPSTLNSLFTIKSCPYGMRSTDTFVGTICKSNIRSFNVVIISLNLWNSLSNAVKRIPSYVLYKNYIKTMLLKLYS